VTKLNFNSENLQQLFASTPYYPFTNGPSTGDNCPVWSSFAQTCAHASRLQFGSLAFILFQLCLLVWCSCRNYNHPQRLCRVHLSPSFPTTCTSFLSYHVSHNHVTSFLFCKLCTALRGVVCPTSLAGNPEFILNVEPPFI
jgi:hypothetical protein